MKIYNIITDKNRNGIYEEDKRMFDMNNMPKWTMIDKNPPSTMEKCVYNQLCVSSIIRKMNKKDILFDHPLQRGEVWSPEVKGNLISDILQGNPVPELIFAEEIRNDNSYIWALDGKQRCITILEFKNNIFTISKKIRRPIIEWYAKITDENGEYITDEDGFPKTEKHTCDIMNKKYSQLPPDLQEAFDNYSFKITQYINCSKEDIAYHIVRYNQGKPMSAMQKGITKIGERFASQVKSLSAMAFFKDCGKFTRTAFQNGTINRIIVEAVMVTNFLDNWEKNIENTSIFIKNNGNDDMFSQMRECIARLETVYSDDVEDMFTTKNTFLWFALFNKFIELKIEDKKFIDFMRAFRDGLHSKEINGVCFDAINAKATKDKKVIKGKMELLETLMLDYFNIDTGKREDISNDEEVVDDNEDIVASGDNAVKNNSEVIEGKVSLNPDNNTDNISNIEGNISTNISENIDENVVANTDKIIDLKEFIRQTGDRFKFCVNSKNRCIGLEQ